MPQKRGEVVEKVDSSQMIPDTFEIWLKKQKIREVKARSGFMGKQETGKSEQEEEDTEEAEIDRTEDLHEKAKRRKRGKGASSSA